MKFDKLFFDDRIGYFLKLLARRDEGSQLFEAFSHWHKLIGSGIFWDKIDIFNDLNKISFYFSLIDQELSNQIQTLDSVLQSYLKWENVLKTKETEILQLRTYAKDHKS